MSKETENSGSVDQRPPKTLLFSDVDSDGVMRKIYEEQPTARAGYENGNEIHPKTEETSEESDWGKTFKLKPLSFTKTQEGQIGNTKRENEKIPMETASDALRFKKELKNSTVSDSVQTLLGGVSEHSSTTSIGGDQSEMKGEEDTGNLNTNATG